MHAARNTFALLLAVVATGLVAHAQQEPQRRSRFRRISPPETLANAIVAQADVNGDSVVDQAEFLRLASDWFASVDENDQGWVNMEEFLRQFGEVVATASSTGFGRSSQYLGFFIALDANKDAVLGQAEFVERFDYWFQEWDHEGKGTLSRDQLVSGIQGALPRTNFGTGALNATQERPPHIPEPPPSPVVDPNEATETIAVADGFSVQLTASEPMIEDPIAISFDDSGALYVVEFRSYMLDIEGSDERSPIGRISRLVDTNGDGKFDQSTIFVDKLIVPRSVAATRGGLLYVADYKLYFASDEDGDGTAEVNKLIDPEYGGGNVEHAPNGLMTAIDNWIYNARSRYRYRWFGNLLVRQATERRGQWGITQDNYGRLLYNVNNSQLLGDFTPPNYSQRNPHHLSTAGLNLFVATDQRVFPIRMNTAVNRGYMRDVLDEEGKLYVFASSCSPLVYRGNNFPPEFMGNAFVCDSAANLIKRNLLYDSNMTLSSRFAYENSEFLASTDERFRPVFLSNGPDGTLWAVDMYRGINQYGMFMTPYLKQESLARGLDEGIHFGRIYRIVSNRQEPDRLDQLAGRTALENIAFLSHPNGWIRDTAQQLIVESADFSVIPQLVSLVQSQEGSAGALGRIHALWTLEGLFMRVVNADFEAVENPPEVSLHVLGLDEQIAAPQLKTHPEVFDACLEAMFDASPHVQTAAIRVAESLARGQRELEAIFQQELSVLFETASPEVQYQIALTVGNLPKPQSLPLLIRMVSERYNAYLIREAVLTGAYRWEVPVLRSLLEEPSWRTETRSRVGMLRSLATAVMREQHPVNIDDLLSIAASQQGQTAWRRDALLAGAAARTGGRSARPIRMNDEPGALATLTNAVGNSEVGKGHLEAIRARLSWSGSPSEADSAQPQARPLTADEQKRVSEGKLVFAKVCAGCHGIDGSGIRPLAAPLLDSDWVLGSEERLIRVILNGLTGEVEVDGITYRPPVVLPEMPSVGVLNDDQIAAVLSYIRRGWGHQAEPVTPGAVAAIRQQTQNRSRPWTSEELDEFTE